MKGIEKQLAGFKFGQHRLQVLEQIEIYPYNGRTYKLLRVRTQDGLEYISLRLYNNSGKFIKQLLVPLLIKLNTNTIRLYFIKLL